MICTSRYNVDNAVHSNRISQLKIPRSDPIECWSLRFCKIIGISSVLIIALGCMDMDGSCLSNQTRPCRVIASDAC